MAHTLSYSMIGLQELNLAYRWPIMYWNTAVLTVDAGILEDNGTTNYGKVSTAIGLMQKDNIEIAPPLINQADNRFKPDVNNNRIIYGFQAARGLGSKVINEILSKRPYVNFKDFLSKVDRAIVTDSKIVQLIKAGAFDDFADKQETMREFLFTLFNPMGKLGLAQLNNIKEMGIINKDVPVYINARMIGFRDYVLNERFLYEEVILENKRVPKCGYHDRLFQLDVEAQEFFKRYYSEDCIKDCVGDSYIISEKIFLKELKKEYIEPLVAWLNRPEIIKKYNEGLYQRLVAQYVKTDSIHWEVEALGYYPNKHELEYVDLKEYGVVDYFSMPDQPEPYNYYPRWTKDESGKRVQKFFPKYTISRIGGTVVDFDSAKHLVALLTPTGVVQVKFNMRQYQYYNRRLSEQDEKGKKTIIDENWFKRNTVLLIAGYKQGDYFRAHRYSDSIYQHTVTKIKGYEIKDNQYNLILQNDRAGDFDGENKTN